GIALDAIADVREIGHETPGDVGDCAGRRRHRLLAPQRLELALHGLLHERQFTDLALQPIDLALRAAGCSWRRVVRAVGRPGAEAACAHGGRWVGDQPLAPLGRLAVAAVDDGASSSVDHRPASCCCSARNSATAASNRATRHWWAGPLPGMRSSVIQRNTVEIGRPIWRATLVRRSSLIVSRTGRRMPSTLPLRKPSVNEKISTPAPFPQLKLCP